MTPPIAVQLYSVRETLAHNFEGTIRQIAAIGYAGVEAAGNYGQSLEATAKLFKDLGLSVTSMHAMPLGPDQNKVIEAGQALGCKYIICAWQPPEQFQTLDGIKRTCETLNAANTIARQHGFTFGYHNHWFEYEPFESSYPAAHMRQWLDPTIVFELDTYWIKTGGQDPVKIIESFGKQAPLLHIKDGPAKGADRDAPNVAVGEGTLDQPAIVKAGGAHTEWLVVEFDRCATDMIEAVRKSYRYLVDKGLGHGRQ
jgi:sugar phosphate isomerase/epimerase